MFPLLSSQMGVYAGWAAYPQTTGYNLPAVVPFPCSVNAARLTEAMQRIADTRETLHTRIVTDENGRPCQYADMSMPVKVERRRMSETEAQAYIANGFVRPFATDGSEPLARFEVLQTPQHHYLLIDIHHIIADGLSIVHSLLGEDLPRAYLGEPLLPFAVTLYDVAAEEERACHTEAYQLSSDHQRQRFAGVSFARLSAEVAAPWGKTLRRSSLLSRQAVDAWCEKHGLAPNLLLMAAFGLVLSRWCRQARIAFTVINHGRRRQYADAYGMFVKSAPVLADTEAKTVIDYIRSMRGELTSTVRHAVYPFTHFCRDMGVTPDVAFGFQSAAIQETVTLGDITVLGRQLPPPMTRNDLSCMVYLSDEHYEVRMESSDALNDPFTLQTVANAVKWTAENMMAHPESLVADIPLISREEQERIIALSQGEPMAYDEQDTFLALFLRQAEKTPDAVAVTDATGSLTYAELAHRSALCAERLLRQGYGKGDIIPVEARQTKEFLIDVIAVWRIGAGYSAARSVPQKGREWLQTNGRDIDNNLDGDSNHNAPRSTFNVPRSTLNVQRNTAYILFTSGSTGESKGVMIPQRALTHLIHFIVRWWGLNDKSRIACHSSVSFDASVEDLYPVLTVGGQLFIVPEEIRRDPERLYHYIVDNQITGGCYTTQWGVLMAQRYDLPVEYLCLGGERLTVNPRCRGRVYNTYGPTEMTVDATYYELEPGKQYKTIPIGRPLPDLSAYVVDADGHLLPQGTPGELWLAGPQMAEGYWGDEALTAQKFTSCRFAEGRVYHTGDLVRWNSDGLLEYIGRIDRQVKLRGYRIEPGEVEAAIARVEGVRQVAVAVRTVGGQDHLCAYYSADRTIAIEEMRRSLSATLPPYMIPVAYLQMDMLPMTCQDKIDYDRLPEVFEAESETDYVAPMTEDERRWCDIFAQVLNVERVGVTDDFFARGGTSLTAVHLLAAAAEQGLHLTYEQIFEHPTVREICSVEGLGPRSKEQENTLPDTRLGLHPNTHPDPPERREKFRVEEKHENPSDSNNNHNNPCSTFNVPCSTFNVQRSMFHVQRSTSHVPCILTGATGFLGIHVLHELLSRGCQVICLVRGADDVAARARLEETWQWYFNTSNLNTQTSNLIVIAADLTDPDFGTEEWIRTVLHNHISCPLPPSPCPSVFIHCAADVRQFAVGDQLYQTNVEGTRNVVRLCANLHQRLIHISTISVGNHGVDTPYIRSKAAAEQLIEDAVSQQALDARILRVGNLTARHSDGVCQRKAEENAFMVLTAALRSLGCYPEPLADMLIDLSPVDDSAKAVVDAVFSASDGLVTDVSCLEKSTLGAIAQEDGLQPVSIDEMERKMAVTQLSDLQRFMLSWWLETYKKANS